MRKLLLLVGIPMMALAFIGCQQGGLAEEEVRSIVQEEVIIRLAGLEHTVGQEVTRQLSGLDDAVGEGVANQLAGIDDSVSAEVAKQLVTLDNLVGQEVANQMANVYDAVRQEVAGQLSNIDTLTVSELYIKNKDGQNAIMLGASSLGSASIIIVNGEGESIVYLGTASGGNGELTLQGSDGEPVAALVGLDNNGMLYLYNKYGEIVTGIGARFSGDGGLGINDKYGEFAFIAP